MLGKLINKTQRHCDTCGAFVIRYLLPSAPLPPYNHERKTHLQCCECMSMQWAREQQGIESERVKSLRSHGSMWLA